MGWQHAVSHRGSDSHTPAWRAASEASCALMSKLHIYRRVGQRGILALVLFLPLPPWCSIMPVSGHSALFPTNHLLYQSNVVADVEILTRMVSVHVRLMHSRRLKCSSAKVPHNHMRNHSWLPILSSRLCSQSSHHESLCLLTSPLPARSSQYTRQSPPNPLPHLQPNP